MTVKEYNEINIPKHPYINTIWNEGIGIIKKNNRSSIAFIEDDLLLFGEIKKILPKLTKSDAERLVSLEWFISDIFGNDDLYFAKKI